MGLLHMKCGKVQAKQYQQIQQIRDTITWKCPDCLALLEHPLLQEDQNQNQESDIQIQVDRGEQNYANEPEIAIHCLDPNVFVQRKKKTREMY